MGKQEVLYYSSSAIYTFFIWVLILFYALDSLFACIQLLKPLYSLYKKRIVLIFLLIIISCIIRIITLVTIKEVQLYQLYLLICSHCTCYQGILLALSSIIFDLSVSLNNNLSQLVKLKLIKYSRFIAFTIPALYAIFMMLFSIKTDDVKLFIVNIVFWFVSFCIFSTIAYYLYYKIKPIYVYGLSYNARKAIKFFFYLFLSFIIVGVGFNSIIQAASQCFENVEFLTLMTFCEFLLCDIIPFSVFLIAFALNREEESQSFLLIDEKEFISSN
ncbi:hypothetical protein SteCoe_3714 [Stentor coeruleus]|uniref:Uncharacterized protein n=1 Tax=Stentor coeruleus TaxID=5963 RepID=A0A1R2CWG3_9CILI|nr:hypothetical protein SteCoe_3714 [Stentor coeruleus]